MIEEDQRACEYDVDRNVNIDGDVDFDDDDHEAGAAILGGIVGLGAGAAIANSGDAE